MDKTLITCAELDCIFSTEHPYLISVTSNAQFNLIPGSVCVRPPSSLAEFKSTFSLLRFTQKNVCIVCYDQVGIEASARLWWYLKAASFTNVKILDGGLRRWEHDIMEGYSEECLSATVKIEVEVQPSMFTSYADIRFLSADSSQLILTTKESFTQGLFDGEGCMLSTDLLKEHFVSHKLCVDDGVLTVVGGEAACSLLIALHLTGLKRLSLLEDGDDAPAMKSDMASKASFYSIEEPLSSYFDCCSVDSNISTDNRPIEYKTVNGEVGRRVEKEIDPEVQQKNCHCVVQ
jgi:rhodanese-related sulfurtransferase